MAGLLEFLNSDDARLGVGLLAAGGPTTDPNQSGFGQRLAAALQFGDQSRQTKLREELLRSQMAENDTQAALRQGQLERQSRMDNYYLGGGFGGAGAQPTGTSSGAMPEGAALKTAIGAPADAPRPPQGKFAEWSQQFNIPVDALVTDYVSNGGKGIADMLYKAGRPDIQVSNGFAYDKNSVKPGYLPQFNVSQDGKSSLTQIGPDGLPIVSAPRGAVETYRAYQGAQADYKPIKVYNPATGREEYSSEGAVVRGGPVTPMAGGTGNVQSSGYAGGDRNAANAESIRMMQSELQNPNLSAADRAGVQREIQRLQVQSGLSNAQVAQSGNFAAGPSAAESAASKAAETRAVDTAKADVARDTSRQAAMKMQGQIGAAASLASQLLEKNPTGSGAGALADSVFNFVGQPTKSGDVAQQLEALSGWMVANVPRMEGPQSNVDVLNYQTMAGRVGDRSLPISTRRAALQTILQLQDKYASVNGGQSATGELQQTAAPKFDSMPSPVQYKGRRIRDTTTGKVLESDGLRWKETQ